MNQTIKHSQMPESVKNPSCTSQHLYQHPTAANTVSYKSKSGLVLPSIIVIAMCAAGLLSCTADQHATAGQVKQISGVKS